MRKLTNFVMGVASVALLAGERSAWADAAPADTAASTGLEEIVVTAQKRKENAQKAPLAVTSLSADVLESAHVTGASDLTRVVPDVNVDTGGSTGDPGGASALFTIRGLGSSATGPQGSAGVAPHFDGIYRQNGISNSEFYDLERIEVDPGPQGTLYGRSAAAGAVNIIPNKPTNEFGGNVTFELGNYGEIRSEGMVNVPVNDMLAIRASFQTQNHDGYFSNGYDDQDAKAGRLQALLKPSDDLSIRLYADYVHLGGVGSGDVFDTFAAGQGLTSLLPQAAGSNLRNDSIDQYCFVNGALVNTCKQSTDITKWSAHLQADYNLGWANLTVIPAYNDQRSNNINANAPLPLSNYNQFWDQRQMNFEARLSDPGDTPLKWVTGISIYDNQFDETINQSVNVLTGLLPVFTQPGPPTGARLGVISINANDNQSSQEDSYAIFGQGTYPVLDWLRFTAGARYNYDSSSYGPYAENNSTLSTNFELPYYINGSEFPQAIATALHIPLPYVTSPIATGPLHSAVRFRALTYHFALDADITPNSLVYGSIGSGYKPGGLGDGAPASANTPGQLGLLSQQTGLSQAALAILEPSQSFGPEKVTHYELGTKNRFWDNRLQINDAFYYDDYSNYQNGQTQVVNPLIYRIQGFVVTNAGQSEVYGDELSIKYKLTKQDLLDFSANYLHAIFTSYTVAAYLTPSAPVAAQNFAGKRLPNAPMVSGNIAYQHFFDLPDGSQLTASVFTHLSGAYWSYFAESPGTHQGSFTSTTLDLTWRSEDERWSVTGFVNNLEDRTVYTFGQNTTGYSEVHLAPPRTFGGSVTAKF